MIKLALAVAIAVQFAPGMAGERAFRDLIRSVNDAAAGRPAPRDFTPAVKFHFQRVVIYNAGADTTGKPDVRVEFAFFSVADDAITLVTRTKRQELTAATLPPGFDLNKGRSKQATIASTSP